MTRQHSEPVPGARRVALVTGAASGIGAAVALRLAQDGHDIALLDIVPCEEAAARCRAQGARVTSVTADISDEGMVAAAFADVARDLGDPLVLVNCAGFLTEDPVHRMALTTWQRVLDVNLTGTFLVTRQAQRAMVRQRWGRIVSLSSTAALGDPGLGHYASAKAGVVALTKTLARELGGFGVTVNAVAPGFTDTAMTRAYAARSGVAFDDLAEGQARRIAVGRVGEAEDIAHAVAFFADARSSFVSGQVLFVAGGPTG